MKRIFIVLLASLMLVVSLTGCSSESKNRSLRNDLCTQPGAYFPDENRYILVDQSYQDIGGKQYLCKVFADRYMGTMYLWMSSDEYYDYSTGGLTQIFYEDGYPMIYDGEEE